MKRAYLKQILKSIADGGEVQFSWKDCTSTLHTTSGETYRIDGRAYQAFIQTVKKTQEFSRIEIGSTDEKNLVIIWKKA